MRALFFKGEARPVCSRKVYHDMFKSDLRVPPTEIMMNGSYFEALCFKEDEIANYYHDRLMEGHRTEPIALSRIQEQARMFDIITKRYGIQVIPKGPDKNTWIKLEGKLEYDKFPEIKFKLEGSSDLVTPVTVKGFNYHRIVLDLKLTIDRNSRYGDYCWGEPQFMDVTQVVFYSYLGNIPAGYLVFDYKKNDRGHKFIPVATLAMFPNKNKAQYEGNETYRVARQRQEDLNILVKDTIHLILQWHNEGYIENPNYDNCNRCPLNPQNQIKQSNPDLICDKAGMIQHI